MLEPACSGIEVYSVEDVRRCSTGEDISQAKATRTERSKIRSYRSSYTEMIETAGKIGHTISLAMILLASLYPSCFHAHATEPVNLLRNPSFEEVGYWRIYTADANDVADPRNATRARTGNYSAYAKATTIGGDGYALVSQDVSVPISPNLEFSFWLYVRRPELPFYGYIKGFIATSSGRFLDVGIWSDLPTPKPNEYRVQAQLERYDGWFRIRALLGKLWIDQAKFPKEDIITTVSVGIYNGLVYALPKNLLQLEVFFDDISLGPSTNQEEPSFPWLATAAICLIGTAAVTAVIIVRRVVSMKRGSQEKPKSPSLTTWSRRVLVV